MPGFLRPVLVLPWAGAALARAAREEWWISCVPSGTQAHRVPRPDCRQLLMLQPKSPFPHSDVRLTGVGAVTFGIWYHQVVERGTALATSMWRCGQVCQDWWA